jgi:hypothetical protein
VRLTRSPRRIAIFLASTSLSLGIVSAAWAQPAPAATSENSDAAGRPNTDPPAIAGSLASVAGSVSFHAAGETQWSPATVNYPVTSGEGFWTEPQGSATIDIADNKIVLDEATEFEVATLDQSQFTVTEAQGALFIQLNSVAQGQSLTINTPRGTVQITQAGRYEIVAGDTNDATTVNVVDGAAHVSGTNLSLDIGPQQSATITGSDAPQGSVGALQMDAFLKTQLQLAQQTSSVPQQCRYMTGARALNSYGSFSQSSQYGQVWYPNSVPANWAPYRDGHWSYVSPWGWTWVDNAPWGFAPFHYGRWAEIDNRWGWIPGGAEPAEYEGSAYGQPVYPIYSPALVAFVGLGAGINIGASLGGFGGGYEPAWIPLGPREPYYPWYHFREGYFARINGFYGVPRDIIDRGPTYINTVNINRTNIFINRRYATVVNADAFARGQSIARIARPVPEKAWAQARPFGERLPVRPTAFTPNLPPEAARRFNITPRPQPERVAAGPRIQPPAPGNRVMPELRRTTLPQNVHAQSVGAGQNQPGHPGEFAPHANGGGVRPGEVPPQPGANPNRGAAPIGRPGEQPIRPQQPVIRPGEPTNAHGLPALRPPGARPDSLSRPPETSNRRGEPVRPGAGPSRLPETAARPGETPRPGAAPTRPGETRMPPQQGPGSPQAARPGFAADHAGAPTRVEPQRPEAPRPAAPHAPPPVEAPRPAPHVEAARPAPHVEPPRAATRPEAARPTPRIETPRPAPHFEAPRPAPRIEAPRPAPRVEVPRPAPRVEAPRPAPRMQAPPPQRPAPRVEAPRPAPRPEPPHPAPHPEQKPHR